MIKSLEENQSDIKKMAERAYKFNAKLKSGGNQLKNKPTTYAVAIKYLLFMRNISLSQFSKYVGITPQCLNHRLNVAKEFYEEDLEVYCKFLRVDFDWFMKLCREISKLEEKEA